MADALHIFRSDNHPGTHRLGIDDDPDLVLFDDQLKHDLCDLSVLHDGQVVGHALPNVVLQSPNGDNHRSYALTKGRGVEIADLTIALPRQPDSSKVHVELPCNASTTIKCALIHPPTANALTLLVTNTEGVKLVEIDRPVISIGRETSTTVRMPHSEVRTH